MQYAIIALLKRSAPKVRDMTNKRLIELLLAAGIFFITAALPHQIFAASIPKRAAIPVPVPPGASLSTQWGISLNPGESITKSALRWTIGRSSNYQSPNAYTSSSRSLGNNYYN